MNFKDWEKLEENEKSVTLVHPKGHTMVIALKSLPKIHQEAIKRLKFAKGGKAEEQDRKPAGTTENYHEKGKQTPIGQMNRRDDLVAYKKSKGPNLKGLSDGGEVRTKKGFWESEDGKKALALQNKEIKNIKERGANVDKGIPNKPHRYDEGGDVEADQPAPAAPPTQITINAAPAAQSPQMTQQPPVASMAAPSQSPQLEAKPVEIPQAKTIQPSGNGLQQEAQKTLNSVEEGKAAIQGQAAVDAAKAQAQVPIEQERLKTEQESAAQDARAMDHVTKATEAFDQYVAQNPINPKHYQESMSTGQKVATGIGLFLGGMGVPFGGHNFAFDSLQKQIDRDIEAQKARTENQKTVYGYYHNLFGDSNVATALARASGDRVMARKIGITAQQFGTPQAQINAKLGIQKLMNDSQEQRVKAAGILGANYKSGAMPKMSQNPSAEGKEAKKTAGKDRILLPGGDDILSNIQYDVTKKDFMPQILEQRAKADMADKALDTLDSYYPQAAKSSQSEAVYSKGALTPFLSSLPFVGSALGSAANAFSDVSPAVRDFESEKTALVGAIRGSLQGNISDELLNSTLDANLPKKGDPPDLLKKKLDTLKRFIHDHTKTDMLEFAGLAKKK